MKGEHEKPEKDKGKDKDIVEKTVAVAGKAAEKVASAAGKAMDVTNKRLNRTGISTSPVQGREIVEAAQQALPSTPGDVNALSEIRLAYAREAGSMGTVPPPSSLRGVTEAAVAAVSGERATFLLDKLGERLAFERTGVRLYEALIVTHEAQGSFAGGPTREQLETIRIEEAAHFALLKKAIEEVGGDPTAVTPSADVAGVESTGVLQVISDPRSSLPQSLHAILVAELTDRDGWEMLIRVADELGKDDLASRFRGALVDEERHLAWVREWLAAHARAEARLVGKPTANQDRASPAP